MVAGIVGVVHERRMCEYMHVHSLGDALHILIHVQREGTCEGRGPSVHSILHSSIPP